MNKDICGIYCIENNINGKKYIGQSEHIYARWNQHKSMYKTSNYILYKAIRKYGIENFSFYIIEQCEKKDLDIKEIYYIDKYNTYYYGDTPNGYNMTIGGDAPMRGRKHTDTTKQLFSIKRTGSGNSFYGKHHDRVHFSRNTPVICLNTMVVYPSIALAAEHYGLNQRVVQKFVYQNTAGKDADGNPLFWMRYDKDKPQEYYDWEYKIKSMQINNKKKEKIKKDYDYYIESDYMTNDDTYIEFIKKHINLSVQTIVCINFGTIHKNCTEAAKYYNLPSHDVVNGNVLGNTSYGGRSESGECLHWTTLKEYLLMSENEIVKILKTPIKNQQPVICNNTKETFFNAQQAADKYGLFRTGVTKCCQGKYHTCGEDKDGNRLSWSYLKEYDVDAKKFNRLLIV